MTNKPVLGYHYIWDIKNCDVGPISNVSFMRELIDEIVSKLGLTVLDKTENQFSPHGATVVYLLAESHISIHTWPEYAYAALDLFSCIPIASTTSLDTIFKKHLGNTIKLHASYIERS